MRRPSPLLVPMVFAVLGVGCRPRGQRATIEGLIVAIDQRDATGALAYAVSSAQLAEVVTCATPTKAPWLTPGARAIALEALRMKYAGVVSAKRVRLGPLFEEYDRPGQWKSYRIGDVVHDDCRAKAAFSIEIYRIVLVISEGSSRPTESTKPIELWKVDGGYYAWDDPMDLEGWR